MTPRARRRLVKLGVRAVAAIFVFTLLSKLVGQLSSVGDSKPDPSSVPSPTACPAEVARWLPGSGDDAVLVAQYRTDRHLVTLCRDRTGQLHYDGQVSGAEVNSENHISLDAVQTANGFTARNKTYLYEINGLELTLKNNGKLISQWRLTRVRP